MTVRFQNGSYVILALDRSGWKINRNLTNAVAINLKLL